MNTQNGYIVRGCNVIGVESYYTGCAGDGFVSHYIGDAMAYESLAGARRKMAILNKMSLVHGWFFSVVGRHEGRKIPAGAMEAYL